MVSVKQTLNTISCSDSDIHPITIKTCTGIQEEELSNQMIVFPSPTSDYLHIQCDAGIQKICIYDAVGRLVKQEHTTNCIDVSGLCSGMYVVKMVDERDRKYFARFEKQ
jgi:hypothetical protein